MVLQGNNKLKDNQLDHKRKILTNIIWLLLEHGVRLFCGVLSTSILARVLGVENYGLFNYVLALILIFQSISYVNPSELMVSKLTLADDSLRTLLVGNAFAIRLFFSIIAYAFLLLLFAYINDGDQFKLALILGLVILLGEAFNVVTAYLQSQTIMKFRSRLVMISDVTKAFTLFVLYQLQFENIYLYAATYVLQSLIVSIGLILIYRSITQERIVEFSLKESYQLLLEGIPFFFGIIVMIVFSRAAIIAMGHLSDETSLGLYSSALQLFSHASIVAPILASSYGPLLVYRHNQNSLVKKNVLFTSAAMFMLGGVTAIILYFFAPILIKLIFGEQFGNAVEVFQYLLIVLPLFFLNEGLNVYLIKMRLARLMSYKWLLALAVSLFVYLTLIPSYGASGAVLGFSLGYFVACIFSLYVILFKHIAPAQSHIDK